MLVQLMLMQILMVLLKLSLMQQLIV